MTGGRPEPMSAAAGPEGPEGRGGPDGSDGPVGRGGLEGRGGPEGQGGPDGPDGLYERLKAYEGCSAATAGVGKDPVNEAMIRHWCEAMGDTGPAYRGPGAIAPPTMLQAWTMGGLSGHTNRSPAYEELFGLLDGAGYISVVATDCEQEYLRPLRPGDRITFDAVIEAVSRRKSTKIGAGYFVTTRMDVRADGEPAGTHRFRILKYAPAAVSRSAATAARPGAAATSGAKLRPRPVINRDNAGFWAGVAEHRLLIQRCGDCRTLRFPWLPGCNACGGRDWDTVEASGEGTVYSHVVMHHPPFPAFSASAEGGASGESGGGGEGGPYAVGLIELAEGVRMVSNVVGVPYDKVRTGMPVRLEFLRTDPELELPVFRGDVRERSEESVRESEA